MEATKCAVVTGGSSGIGQGIALVLAEHGYDVAITYGKNPEGAEKPAVRSRRWAGAALPTRLP